jgi:hypothetical protein
MVQRTLFLTDDSDRGHRPAWQFESARFDLACPLVEHSLWPFLHRASLLVGTIARLRFDSIYLLVKNNLLFLHNIEIFFKFFKLCLLL